MSEPIGLPAPRLCAVILAPLLLASCDHMKSLERQAPQPASSQSAASPAPSPAPAPQKDVPTRLAIALVDPAGTPRSGQAAVTSIAARIDSCWESVQPPDPPAVPIELALYQDGSVRSVTVLDRSRFAADAGFRAAATAATSAFFKCSPFVLPAASYADWKSLKLRVTPYHG